jgi:uncharacterized protein
MKQYDPYSLEEFVRPFYDAKDTMHDLTHLARIWQAAQRLIKENAPAYSPQFLVGGLYLHGIIYEQDREQQARNHLRTQGCPQKDIDYICSVAWDSSKDKTPSTPEGKILHDAHSLEGDEGFLITKCLVTGTARGQALQQTVDYFFKYAHLFPPFCFKATEAEYRRRHCKAVEFFTSLRTVLAEIAQ